MKITLAGSKWLHETTARWRAEAADAKLDIDQQRLAVNKQVVTRSEQAPLDRLYAAKKLDPDFQISVILHSAGVRYYSDWYLSGLSGISGIDYSRIGMGGGESASDIPISEMQAIRRDAYRAAKKHLGARWAPIVEAVVLEERPLNDVLDLTGYKDKSAGSAVALERLNTGLRRLAVHYRLIRP
jgi:hypothetical protein